MWLSLVSCFWVLWATLAPLAKKIVSHATCLYFIYNSLASFFKWEPRYSLQPHGMIANSSVKYFVVLWISLLWPQWKHTKEMVLQRSRFYYFVTLLRNYRFGSTSNFIIILRFLSDVEVTNYSSTLQWSRRAVFLPYVIFSPFSNPFGWGEKAQVPFRLRCVRFYLANRSQGVEILVSPWHVTAKRKKKPL